MKCACGRPATTDIEVVQAGDLVLTGAQCARCHARALAGLRTARRHFALLLRQGLSRERANALMIKRIERGCYHAVPEDA